MHAIGAPSVSVSLPRDEEKRRKEVKQQFLDVVGTAAVVLRAVAQKPEKSLASAASGVSHRKALSHRSGRHVGP